MTLAVDPDRARGRMQGPAGTRLRPATIDLIEALVPDERVVAVLLRGSASFGMADDRSDDDLVVVVDQEVPGARLLGPRRLVVTVPDGHRTTVVCDAMLQTLAELDRLRRSTADTDRWPFEQARVLHAVDGRAGAAVGRLASMDPDFREQRIRHGLLDVVIAADRARTCEARRQVVEQRLILIRGARALSRVLFAMEWRWVPLDQWLTFGLSTLHDGAACSRLVVDVLSDLSWRPLALAETRLRVVLEDLLPAVRWDRTGLRSALRGPGAHQQRAVHGLC